MTPADRLTAAADRLEALDLRAPSAPWRAMSKDGVDYDGTPFTTTWVGDASSAPVAVPAQQDGRQHEGVADLIATLRPLAAPIAAWLRECAQTCALEDAAPGANQEAAEVAYHRALAVADAVLAATGGA